MQPALRLATAVSFNKRQLTGYFVLHFLLLMLIADAATAPAEHPLPPWNVACTTTRDKCWMELFVPFTGPDKQERGGVAVAYDAVAKKPMFITVFVPPDIGTKHEVTIGLIKTVPDKQSWKLEPSKSGLMSLPVMECDLQFCMARVYPQIDNGDGTTTDLFAQMQSNDFIWVLFEQNGKPIRFMIPILEFRSALARAQVVPQDSTNQPVQSTPGGTK